MPTLPHRYVIGQSYAEFQENNEATVLDLIKTVVVRMFCRHIFEERNSFGHSGIVEPGVRTYPCTKCGLKESRLV